MNYHTRKKSIAIASALILLTGSASAAERTATVYNSTGSPPTISHLICPDVNNSGGGIYMCRLIFSSPTPAVVSWPDGSDQNEFMGVCLHRSRPTVTVTVTNAAGSTSRSNTFACPTGPIP
jgi:hypothetical protein